MESSSESSGAAAKYNACRGLSRVLIVQLMFIKWLPGVLDVDHHNNDGPGRALTSIDSFGVMLITSFLFSR